MQMTSRWKSLLTLTAALSMTGCIFGIDNTGTPESNDKDTAIISDVASDAADVSDDTSTDEDTTSGSCTKASDCKGGPPHTEASCEGQSCRYKSCESGWKNVDGDLQTNGCECKNSEVEAHYRDGDGDGFGDDKNNRMGCGMPPKGWSLDNSDCDDSDKSVHPDVPADENWQCDGVDNDCSGGADEVCCSPSMSGDVGLKTDINPNNATQVAPVIVEAGSHRKTPKGAAFLVAWAEGKTLYFQHVDRAGSPKGKLQPVSATHPIDDVALSRTDDGYFLGYSTYEGGGGALRNTESEVGYARLGADGTLDGQLQPVKTDSGGILSGSPDGADAFKSLEVGVAGKARMLIYTVDDSFKPDQKHEVKAFLYVEGSGTGKAVSASGDPKFATLPDVAKPVVSAAGNRIVVAWWHAAEEKIAVTSHAFRKGGTRKVAETIGIPVNRDSKTIALRIGLAAIAKDKFAVMFPDYGSGPNADINLVGVSFAGRTTQTSPETLVSKGDNSAPTASAVDLDGDGRADRLVYAWLSQMGGPSGKLMTATRDVSGSKQAEAPRTITSVGHVNRNVVAMNGSTGALLWLQQDMKDRARFAPLSLQGVPICK